MIRKTMLAALMATALIPAAAGSRPVQVDPVARAAWKHKPNWYVLNREDRMLTPQLQSATVQRIGARLHSVPASHVSMLSHPGEVADVILEAAGVKSAAPSPAKTGG
ncbi:alpha/beta fold hydrolase [Archangium lansingense]|uniref:AB hydrolase-1 domain-containing protein n=1 Tax=Archangium lansingense TaxID=2995310 RepID=A0ABT4A2A8_9BACT|nr:alpha/beta fold hydrolase [Archangium lansinium]MCY1075781.1 hypothetical protein [Archangium lansinium]